VGYQVRHNTDVQPGVEKTDTLTTVGLLYETK
jgi:putative salt-induced outer membrane protein YdiY